MTNKAQDRWTVIFTSFVTAFTVRGAFRFFWFRWAGCVSVDCQQDSDWNSDVRNIVGVVAVPFCKRDFCVSPPSEKWTLRSDGGNDIPDIYYIKMTIVLNEKECRDDSNEIIPWMVDCSGTSFDDPIHVFMMKTRWRAFLMRWCPMGIIYYMYKLAS